MLDLFNACNILNLTNTGGIVLLGVNIDHVATLREARKALQPDIMTAAILAQLGGADGITVHLRQDRRHINESDIVALRAGLQVPLNVEISTDKDIVDFILNIVPDKVCMVPESPKEITTEGGLNLKSKKVFDSVNRTVKKLQKKGIEVSLFIEPDRDMIDLACKMKADAVELNTNAYSESETVEDVGYEYARIESAADYAAVEKGLIVNAGHGLDYDNVHHIVGIDTITELNIGHSIVAKSVMTGIEEAVAMMRDLIDSY